MATPDQELKRSPLSLVDETGAVFIAPDRVLRAVHPGSEAAVEALLGSGLPDELAARGLMPATRRSGVLIPGYRMVLEHPRLPVVSYPYEWSYGMLRDAAALVLEINQLANARGYELKDCHPFNVLFDGPRPCFVDLGSLTLRPTGARGWLALEEFVRSYEYPLRIWADGGEFIARRLVASSNLMSHVDHGLYRWPWLRWVGADPYQKTMRRWYGYRRLSCVTDEKIRNRFSPTWANLLCRFKNKGWLPAQTVGLSGLRNRVLNRRRGGPGGFWSNYQGVDATFVDTPRFRRIGELVRQSGVGSILELAGNQGRLSEELLRAGAVRQALCTDADERAIDQAHERTRVVGGKLHTAVLDFIHPMTSPFGESPAQRLQADAVLALAVTHHLLLTEKIPLERIFRSIAAFAHQHVFIEFMPLGLWDGKKAHPVPGWYNLEWFRTAFGQEFELWHEERLEENRHLFCGRLRADRTFR